MKSALYLLIASVALSALLFSNQTSSAIAGPHATGFLYGATGSASLGGELFILNPRTGAVIKDVGPLVDDLGNHYGITGLAFSSNDVLYGSTTSLSFAPGSLVIIDPTSAKVTLIGPFLAPGTMADLTFDPSTEKLFGASSFGADLYTINETSGAATLVGPSGFVLTKGSALAANAEGTIYGAPAGANGQLIIYDKTTGAATTVAFFSGAPFPTGNIGAMAFSGESLLGANIDLNNLNRRSHLVSIDPATGVISDGGPSVDKLDAIAVAPASVSRNLCKQGGWQSLTRADGSSFKNQGDCIQYVNTGK